jgi:transposase
MDQRKEQRLCIKFCANLGKSVTETLEMIQQGFGDQSLSRAQVFQWHARFKTGRTSVDDDEHTGRSTSWTTPETVARIQELIRQDRRLTIRDIAEEVEVGYGTCQRVLTILPVEKPHITKAKKGQTGEKQSKEHDHHFL